MDCCMTGRPSGGLVASRVAEEVVRDARQRERSVPDPQQRLREMRNYIATHGFRVGSRVRHTSTGDEFVIVEITRSHQLRVRPADVCVPKQGTFAPDVFVAVAD